MSLTKPQIVDTISEANGSTKQRSFEILESLLEILKGTLSSGEDVLVSGFGRFCVKEKDRRLGRNPSTGEKMMIGSRRVVTFKCSGRLRRNLNAI